jgi:hypothetical protein
MGKCMGKSMRNMGNMKIDGTSMRNMGKIYGKIMNMGKSMENLSCESPKTQWRASKIIHFII